MLNLNFVKRWLSLFLGYGLALVILAGCEPDDGDGAVSKDEIDSRIYRIAWSHYTAWEPLEYIDSEGILDRWGNKYGVNVELVLVNDYVESLTSYTSGLFDGVMSTNMDALTIPAASGVDSAVILVTSFSNGNDGLVAKESTDIEELKGARVNLVEYSVSHYLLSRALDSVGMSLADIDTINTSESDIDAVFMNGKGDAPTATWNPILVQLKNQPGTHLLYDSSHIPGEIVEMMLVRNHVPEEVRKALTGAWYEMMATYKGDKGEEVSGGIVKGALLERFAQSSGGTLDDYLQQLETTHLFENPANSAAFMSSDQFVDNMDRVRQFCSAQGLFGPSETSLDAIGMRFPNDRVLGSAESVLIHFNDSYMRMAADGRL